MKPTIKHYIIALVLTALFVWGILYHRETVNALERAKSTLIEQSMIPTELESKTIELESNRIERAEMQKEIDVIVAEKKLKAERADELQKQIIEITGIVFQ